MRIAHGAFVVASARWFIVFTGPVRQDMVYGWCGTKPKPKRTLEAVHSGGSLLERSWKQV